MGFLSAEELGQLLPSETTAFPGPIPTQIVSSDEYYPTSQTPRQRAVEARVKALGAELAKRQGITRRRFFQTAAGMAAAFLVMNEVYGPLYDVSRAEAADGDVAQERAQALRGQFIMDTHTHFLRDDTRIQGFLRQREAVGKAGWNPALSDKPQTLEDLKYNNSSAPSDLPADWFLTNEMTAAARARVNSRLGARRMLSHAIFTPGQPGWMEEVDKAITQLGPDSFKGYTIGDNTNKNLSKYPWRLDDDTLVYPFYEKALKAGLVNICIHKGLFPPSVERNFPHLRPYCDVRDVGRAAQDWPQLNYIIYHGAYRFPGGGNARDAWTQFEQTGRIEWVSDLAAIPATFAVQNVYADTGQLFAQTTVAEPRVAAALLGMLIKGLGADHVIWGTDAIWTGSPQWQIEALRRLEIPEDMQKRYGYAPLGPADGPIKTAIFGENVARLYNFKRQAELGGPRDRLAAITDEYERAGGARSNLRYGYIARG